MSGRNAGLTADPLFVAVTRPPMRWGVTFSALLFNLVFTMEVFLLTRNLLTLLACRPDSRRLRVALPRGTPESSISSCSGAGRACRPTPEPIATGGRAATARSRSICQIVAAGGRPAR